jgi:hypothetical protein
MSQSDYERGQKHGNEFKYARRPGFFDLLGGGEDYAKGIEASYKQRTDKAGLFGSTERKEPSDSKNSSSYSGSSYYDGDDSSSLGVSGWLIGLVVAIILLALIGFCTQINKVNPTANSVQNTQQNVPEAAQPEAATKENVPSETTREEYKNLNTYHQDAEDTNQPRYNEFTVPFPNTPANNITLTRAEVYLPGGESKPARVSDFERRGNTMIVHTFDYYPVGTNIHCNWQFEKPSPNYAPAYSVPPTYYVPRQGRMDFPRRSYFHQRRRQF